MFLCRAGVITVNVVYENKVNLVELQDSTILGKTMHLHKELEIVYTVSGQSMAYADKNSYLLNPGDMFIAFPNQIHYYDTVKPGKFIVLIFSSEVLCGFSAEISKSIPNKNFVPAGEEPELDEIFKKVCLLVRNIGGYNLLKINGYINIIMSTILPHFVLKTANFEKNSAFYSVMDYCTHNFTEPITLDSVAEVLHLSKYYISHLINRKLGQNFNEYINSLRINEACAMLRETDKKISDISEEVGFGTIRSFNRSFKQITSVSPAEYRLQIAALKSSER